MDDFFRVFAYGKYLFSSNVSRGGWMSLFRGLCLLVWKLLMKSLLCEVSLLPWMSLPVDEPLDEEVGSGSVTSFE
jgi:hypothetical protein